MDLTLIALILVSALLVGILARDLYVAYTTRRAAKRQQEAMLLQAAANVVQENINEHHRQFKKVTDDMETINQRQDRTNQAQEKLIADLTAQVNRLLLQLDTDALRHGAVEKASLEKNERLQDENEKLVESQH